MKSHPRISALRTPAVVGRTYLVPHIKVSREMLALASVPPGNDFWPVLGPPHEDALILNQPKLHYHLDWRFLTDEQLRIWGGVMPHVQVFALAPDIEHVVSEHEMAAKCLRPPEKYPHCIMQWMPELEHHYRKARVDCRVCPHRGTPLGSLPVAKGGGVTCPSHGLRWHVETGKLLRRKVEC